MPSAAAKVEKVASSEANDPLKSVVNMLEKKMRNLEKRKVKLDNYKNEAANGKELNEDQKIAVSKGDEVKSLLEFAKDLIKQVNTIVQEHARQQKKLAKKEQLERQQLEIQRLTEAYMYVHILSHFQNEDVRSDFLNGTNGAVQLTSEQLSQLDQLYKLIGSGFPNEHADLSSHFHTLAENHIFLVEGKNKEIVGTTYKALKEVLQTINECGYLTRSSEPADATSSDETPEEEGPVENVVVNQEVMAPAEDIEIVPSPCNEQVQTEEEANPVLCSESVPEDTPSDVPNIQNGPLQEVLSSQSSFNFLQESQIDLDAPHMDPAVVAVHQMAPPPTVNFAVNPYPPTPPVEDTSKPQVNGSEPCDVSPPPPPPTMSQVPIISAGIPHTVTPVLTSVQHNSQHDFDPSHPIPTQTFTNQSFAVMQNMIMPQAYVPVTMHHGHIPPHIGPIAVVPGLSPPVTSTGPSVVPIHLPVPPVPIASVPENGVPNDLEAQVSEREDSQSPVDENAADGESNVNGTSSDKNADGYTPSYRGYRGRGRGRGNGGYFRGRNNYNSGRGGYQNHYYQDRNGYNGNYRRNNNRGSRGNGNNRGRGGNFRTSTSQQQQQQQTQQ